MASLNLHWSRLHESGTLLGMQLLLLTYRLTGRWGFRALLLPVMIYYYVFRPSARWSSRQYRDHFRQRFPDTSLGRWAGLRHFLMFGETLLDKLLAWMGHIHLEDVEFPEASKQCFESMMMKKKGAVLIVSHLGNIELTRALARRFPDMKMTVLVHTHHATRFNSLLKRIAPEGGIELLQVTEMTPATAMTLAERIDRGELVVIAGDRTPINGTMERVSTVDFLGTPAPFPQGPIVLSGLLKCPVLLMFCLKGDKHYTIFTETFAEQIYLPRAKRGEIIESEVARFAKRLEVYCRMAPLQWFNFYDFWQESGVSAGKTSSGHNDDQCRD